MRTILSAFIVSGICAGSALAQTPKEKATQARSEASIECSKQADDKGLHGKARKKFRSKCMKDMKKKI